MRSFRKRLLDEEQSTRNQLAAAYRQSLRSITRGIAEATRELSGMGPEPMFDPRGRFTDRGQIEWRRDRLRALERQIVDEIARLTDESAARIANGQRTMTQLGSEHAAGLVQAQAPELAASFVQLPRAAFATMVGATEAGPLRDLLARHGAVAADEGATILRNAIAEGVGPREVARQLRRLFGVAQWQAERIARTEMLKVYRAAALEQYAANSDIVRGWVWMSTLSSRTCLNCLSRHGSEWPMTTRFFPGHPSCRCSPAPLLRGADNPIATSGASWFETQPEVTQRTMMGPKAFDLYQRGEVALADFEGYRDDRTWGPMTYQRSVKEITSAGRQRRAA